MSVAKALVVSPASPDAALIDQRVFMHDVTWEVYEALLALRGENSSPRLTYLEGELELMSPSWSHEIIKKRIARLLEAWSEEMDIPLDGAGSWTIRNKKMKRGAEPDECYVVGDIRNVEAPDIAIEVVWTHGGIDKLDVYRKLGVREVWVWKAGALQFHVLRGTHYALALRSEVLPTFDFAVIAPFLSEGTQPEAVKALRLALRAAVKPTKTRKKE